MLRQQGIPHMPQGMLMNNGPFLPPQQQQQSPPQGQQPQSQQQHMTLLQNNPTASNPNMGLLASAQTNPAAAAANYQLQMAQANQQRQNQRGLFQQQGLNPQVAAGPSHVNGIPHPQLQAGMTFMNPPIRRVPSQPQGLNASGPHIGGMHTGQPLVGAVGGMAGMNLNPQGIPAHLRQQQQQQQMNLRLQQQQQQQQHQPLQMQSGPMTSDIMGMNRQTHIPGAPGLPPHARSTSAQLMNPLSQQSAMSQSHPGGMQQPPLQQQGFLAHHQQQSHIPQNHAGGIPPNMTSSSSAPQLSANRTSRMTPDNTMFANFQNHAMPQNMQHSSRMPPNNAQFTYVPSSSTPPNTMGDMSQAMSGPPMNAAGTRGGLIATPAQAFEQINQSGADSYSAQFNMAPSQTSAPPRPPSQQHASHPGFVTSQTPQSSQSLQVHHSPRPPQLPTQRPQSQPQVPNQGHSPQQAGPSRTPRSAQQPLPPNNGFMSSIPISRGPPMSGQPTGIATPTSVPRPPSTPAGGVGTPRQISASQQPNLSANVPTPTSAPAPPAEPSAPVATHPLSIPRSQLYQAPVGSGQGVLRMLQFSGILASDSKDKLSLAFWDKNIRDFFTHKAMLKFTLWKDNQRNEAKPFEIGVPILPRFFLVTSQSGVKSMHISLDGARERLVTTGHGVVECVHAVWTYRYTNGYTVTLRGPMTCHVVVIPNPPGPNHSPSQPVGYTLKFDQLQFDANYHDKLISMDFIGGNRRSASPMTPRLRTPNANGNGLIRRPEDDDRRFEEPRLTIEGATFPPEPVNAFGIPQATMRCLELAESVAQMSDLIQYSQESELGPIDALAAFAQKIREGNVNGSNLHRTNMFDGSVSSNTHVANSTASDPSKQPKATTTTTQQQSASTPNSGPPSVSTPAAASTPSAATSTPSMSHSTLKRKAQSNDTTSPTTGNSDQAPPAKRVPRKRGRTQGG
ncbi:hypothetical protein ABKN59_000053 [Abortiporus biennis]